MNMCGALVLLGLIVVARAAVLIPDGAREPDCGAYMLPACTKEFEPVCGTDGATHANECILCRHNSENKFNVLIKNMGEC